MAKEMEGERRLASGIDSIRQRNEDRGGENGK
jgi:hypothetical protein